jgi:transcriptional regulator with XRE-family HTH domain
MLPFGPTVVAWRLARGMSQESLARAAGVPRPNLSAIERGDREVTLKTLRALAAALEVRPGVLVDGEPPHAAAPRLTRAALERISRAATRGTPTRTADEAALAAQLREVTSIRRTPVVGRSQRPGPRLSVPNRAYFRLRSRLDPDTLASLLERVAHDFDRDRRPKKLSGA